MPREIEQRLTPVARRLKRGAMLQRVGGALRFAARLALAVAVVRVVAAMLAPESLTGTIAAWTTLVLIAVPVAIALMRAAAAPLRWEAAARAADQRLCLSDHVLTAWSLERSDDVRSVAQMQRAETLARIGASLPADTVAARLPPGLAVNALIAAVAMALAFTPLPSLQREAAPMRLDRALIEQLTPEPPGATAGLASSGTVAPPDISVIAEPPPSSRATLVRNYLQQRGQ